MTDTPALRPPDLTDIVTWLRKTDAFHDPSEANDLMTRAATDLTTAAPRSSG